jgi:RND family efflux transporter MFP subunit
MNQEPILNFSPNFMRRLKGIFIMLFAIALIGISYHIITYIMLIFSTNKHAILNVATIHAAKGPATEEVILPGNVTAWHDATIYARTNGYVVKWVVDIGTHVKMGDLLAELAAPEVDAQLRQTEADLKTAEANYTLAHTTAIRWIDLLKTESVSKQETDEKVSDEKAKLAVLNATRANRDRLLDLVNFQRILSPFDGTIMSRTTDIGSLINAGSGSVPLFRLTQSNHLRVYVKVPEYYDDFIQSNMNAQLYFTEHPGKAYTAKLLNMSKSLDPVTRTLEVQFEMDNTNEELKAGSYTQVHLTIPANAAIVRLPVNTLIFRAHGLQVATIDGDNKAELKSITMGRDFGDTVEITSGIKSGETIILNPSDSLMTGQEVKIVSADDAAKGDKA